MATIPDVQLDAQARGRIEPLGGVDLADVHAATSGQVDLVAASDQTTTASRTEGTPNSATAAMAIWNITHPRQVCLLCDPEGAAGNVSSSICDGHPDWIAEQLAYLARARQARQAQQEQRP